MTRDGSAASTRALRRSNAEAVLRYALSQGAFHASDAMAATGLTRSTVIGHLDELFDVGWIVQLDNARTAGEYSKGRPARRFELRYDAGLIVGVDAGQHGVTVLVTDLRASTLARVRGSFAEAGLDPDLRVAVMTATIDAALADIGASREAILVTVFGVPAPVDEAGRSPVGEDGYWAHMNPDLPDRFAGYGLVVVENDANLAAIAEGALGAGRNSRSFAALLSGERFGAGIIMDDALIRGRHGGAGEMRILDLVEGVGSADGLAALTRDWAAEARRLPDTSTTPSLRSSTPPDITAEAIFASADRGDEASLAIVNRLGDRLARVCFVLASLLDVDRVIIAGAIASASGTVVARARRLLESEFYEPVPEIVASPLGADVVVLGAIERGLSLVRASPLGFAPTTSRASVETESEREAEPDAAVADVDTAVLERAPRMSRAIRSARHGADV